MMFILNCFLSLCLMGTNVATPEMVFVQIQGIDFSRHKGYSISDYNSSFYFIDYEGASYLGRIPLGEEHFISLNRILSERERDSLMIPFGEAGQEAIPISSSLAADLEDICGTFRSIWQIAPKEIYLLKLVVDNANHVLLTIMWKETEEVYKVLITPDSKDVALKNLEQQEVLFCDSYVEIGPGLYFRRDAVAHPKASFFKRIWNKLIIYLT